MWVKAKTHNQKNNRMNLEKKTNKRNDVILM